VDSGGISAIASCILYSSIEAATAARSFLFGLICLFHINPGLNFACFLRRQCSNGHSTLFWWQGDHWLVSCFNFFNLIFKSLELSVVERASNTPELTAASFSSPSSIASTRSFFSPLKTSTLACAQYQGVSFSIQYQGEM